MVDIASRMPSPRVLPDMARAGPVLCRVNVPVNMPEIPLQLRFSPAVRPFMVLPAMVPANRMVPVQVNPGSFI